MPRKLYALCELAVLVGSLTWHWFVLVMHIETAAVLLFIGYLPGLC